MEIVLFLYVNFYLRYYIAFTNNSVGFLLLWLFLWKETSQAFTGWSCPMSQGRSHWELFVPWRVRSTCVPFHYIIVKLNEKNLRNIDILWSYCLFKELSNTLINYRYQWIQRISLNMSTGRKKNLSTHQWCPVSANIISLLCRRLNTLNKCAVMKLEISPHRKRVSIYNRTGGSGGRGRLETQLCVL